MQFQITNTRIEDEKLVVFYQFSNGEVNSNSFNSKATVTQIMKWGEDRAKWFEDSKQALEILSEEVITE